MPELCNQGLDKLACFLCVSCVLLVFCLHAPAFYRLKKACGATFVPFYSVEMENLSKNGTKVAQPQHETEILIENGNKVA